MFSLCSKDKKLRFLNGQVEAKSPLIKLRYATFPGYLLHKYHGVCSGPLLAPTPLTPQIILPNATLTHPLVLLSLSQPRLRHPRPRRRRKGLPSVWQVSPGSSSTSGASKAATRNVSSCTSGAPQTHTERRRRVSQCRNGPRRVLRPVCVPGRRQCLHPPAGHPPRAPRALQSDGRKCSGR